MKDIALEVEELQPEAEEAAWMGLLWAMTVVARMLWWENKKPEDRSRILLMISEINHRVLNRISALSGGDDCFTVNYTFGLIHEHLRNAPELEPWVKRILIRSTNLAEARPRD